MAYAFYGFTTVLFVVLLCVRILPSCSHHYTHALVWTQLLLVGVAQIQDSTFQEKCNKPPLVEMSIETDEMRKECPRNFWWVAVLGTYFVCWLVMFWVVPVSMDCPEWFFKSCTAVRNRARCCKWRPSSKQFDDTAHNGTSPRKAVNPVAVPGVSPSPG